MLRRDSATIKITIKYGLPDKQHFFYLFYLFIVPFPYVPTHQYFVDAFLKPLHVIRFHFRGIFHFENGKSFRQKENSSRKSTRERINKYSKMVEKRTE